ncbi:MAG: leucyl aminopeptidase [Oscillibacter sp.]|jgi:leucyl aminopeptidase (aminopeptidase T)|nr:leucyl aminopeptidase [Oscillibacter sp.]
MPTYLDLEVARAAYKIMHDLVQVKPGESVLITSDSKADFRPTEELAKAAEILGGKVMVAWHSTPKGYGALTMPYLPEPLKACVDKTDVWIEMNDQWLLYSPIWDKAVTNGRTRQVMLGGLGVERIVRLFGEVDIPALKVFQDTLTDMVHRARRGHIINAAGTDVSFEIDGARPVTNEIRYDIPGGHFMIGQIGWGPKEGTINGVIAFDGTISGGGDADLGKLEEPVFYDVKADRIQAIRGGWQADKLRAYYASLEDPNMYLAAHVCFGVLPTAQLGECTTENERVWGSTQWGFGHQGSCFTGGEPRTAKSHIDGICLSSTVWLDDVKVLENGKFVEPRLAELARAFGK